MSDTISKNDQGFLDRHFKLKAKGTNVRTAIIAGITTFVAMAYIIFVNPSILKEAGPFCKSSGCYGSWHGT